MPQGQAPAAGIGEAAQAGMELLGGLAQALGQVSPEAGEQMAQLADAFQQIMQGVMQQGQQQAPQVGPEAGAAPGAVPQTPQGR